METYKMKLSILTNSIINYLKINRYQYAWSVDLVKLIQNWIKTI